MVVVVVVVEIEPRDPTVWFHRVTMMPMTTMIRYYYSLWIFDSSHPLVVVVVVVVAVSLCLDLRHENHHSFGRMTTIRNQVCLSYSIPLVPMMNKDERWKYQYSIHLFLLLPHCFRRSVLFSAREEEIP